MKMTMRDGVDLAKIAVGVAIAIAIGVATVVGYRVYQRDYAVTTNPDGTATARVVAATLFSRSDLRVSQLSGTVQGVARADRLWGWLPASQVVKAPYDVDYFVPLQRLDMSDFRYDADRRVLFVNVPDVVPQRPNIDLANTTLNQTRGVFVSRGAMAEMGRKVAGSAQAVAAEKARSPENMDKARAYGRAAIERLFVGALGAAGLDARVEVRFAGEPQPGRSEQWDMTRSLDEVLGNAR